MGEKQFKSIEYTAKHSCYEVLNSQLTKARCYVMASGKNANMSDITLESIQKCVPLIGNTPVVAHLYEKSDGTGLRIGGHDRELKISDSDGFAIKDLTVPFGVIPENCNPEIVTVLESDGITKNQYLVVDVILWTGRYPIMDTSYSNDVYFNQSCELLINKCHYDNDDYLVIEDFTLSALCLLNKSDKKDENVRPCFPSCRVEKLKYSLEQNTFKQDFALLMQEVKALAFEDKKNTKEEKHDMKDKILSILSTYKFKNQCEAEACKYVFVDMTDTTIDVLDREDDYKAYTLTYSVAEDESVAIDFEGKVEKSISATDKVEDSFSFKKELDTVSSEMVLFAVTAYEVAAVNEINGKYEQMKADYDLIVKENDANKTKLQAFEVAKTESEKALHKVNVDKVVEEFSQKMGTFADFLIYRSKLDYSKTAEQVSTDLLLLLGKANMNKKSSFSYQPVVCGVPENTGFDAGNGNGRYGNLFDKVKK